MVEGRLPCLPGDHTCASPPFTRVHHTLTYPSFQSSLHPIRTETETNARRVHRQGVRLAVGFRHPPPSPFLERRNSFDPMEGSICGCLLPLAVDLRGGDSASDRIRWGSGWAARIDPKERERISLLKGRRKGSTRRADRTRLSSVRPVLDAAMRIKTRRASSSQAVRCACFEGGWVCGRSFETWEKKTGEGGGRGRRIEAQHGNGSAKKERSIEKNMCCVDVGSEDEIREINGTCQSRR